MSRGLVILIAAAATCLAQSDTTRGFVNQRLLSRVHLPAPKGKVPAPGELPASPCLRVSKLERIPVKDVDRKMILPFHGATGDEKMIIKPAPVCPEK